MFISLCVPIYVHELFMHLGTYITSVERLVAYGAGERKIIQNSNCLLYHGCEVCLEAASSPGGAKLVEE